MMQPMTPILLYCADENLLAAAGLALKLRHYDVAPVCDARGAITLAGGKDNALACGVLIHAQQGDLAGRLIHRILACASHMPLLLVDRAGDLAPVRYADMVLYGRNITMAHILAALDVLCRHEPGTRPRRVA